MKDVRESTGFLSVSVRLLVEHWDFTGHAVIVGTDGSVSCPECAHRLSLDAVDPAALALLAKLGSQITFLDPSMSHPSRAPSPGQSRKGEGAHDSDATSLGDDLVCSRGRVLG